MNLNLSLPLRRDPARMRITRPFGADPEAYARFGMRGHNGIDFETEEGELVVAVDDGEVVEVRFDRSGYGVTVKLAHPWGESRYAHGRRLSVPIDFALGHLVRAGDRIFLAGGTHLHVGLRIRRDDGSLDCGSGNGFRGWQDPLPYLRQALGLPAPSGPAAPAARARKAA
jgi:murein DD-endopeptidase MepM/ murein hydrolase activator NlpD